MKTFGQVRDEKPKTIYYSANTVWWTHDPKDLKKSESGLPLDAFGSPLFQSDDVDGFLNAGAVLSAEAYGKVENRVRNLMMAHAQNIGTVCEKMPPKSFDLIKNYSTFCKWCDDNINSDNA